MTRRAAKRITPSYLRNSALYYLDRFGTSRANLRRVMMRKINRGLAEHGGDRDEAVDWLEALLDDLERLGYVNDAEYAASRARALHRGGAGERKIRAKLREKGIASETIDRALEALAERTRGEHPPDLVAAARYARSRRLGPYRKGDHSPESRRKELGKLARAGFDYEIAMRVVDMKEPDMIDEIIDSGLN